MAMTIYISYLIWRLYLGLSLVWMKSLYSSDLPFSTYYILGPIASTSQSGKREKTFLWSYSTHPPTSKLHLNNHKNNRVHPPTNIMVFYLKQAVKIK